MPYSDDQKWGYLGGLAARPWLIVPVVASLHLTYGICLLANPSVARITAVHLLERACGPASAYVLIAVALLSLIPMIKRMRAETVHLFLWPQQTVLFLMAASGLLAAFTGLYPDGTARSFSFIFADQCYTWLLAAGHLAATMRNALLGKGSMDGRFR